ncbi:MAG: ABC-ATPase domain-containing protein [Lachnospiraceae bacterium]|nr:ABC-ATPase domain-containing protein [Lachnospiraceae bacterium]
MKSSEDLRALLRSIDHKGYPAYKTLAGEWKFPKFVMGIDHVQGDPFASPSALHVELPMQTTGIPEGYYQSTCTMIAEQDFLTRELAKQFEQYNFKAKGSGKSGLLSISHCGQEVLERSACEISSGRSDRQGESDICGRQGRLTVRFHVGFPAFGRTINAGELDKILFDFLPRCVENSLFYARLDKKKLEQAVFLAEDQQAVRDMLKEQGLVAFVANGAVLPRKSGVSALPMKDSVAFQSPASMERSFKLPHRGDVSGMAVPQGITLIVGGGYHGKSTLLEAIQAGVYNHIAGDGRELVITDDTAVKQRAEDGRSVRNVDISLFINDLPNKKNTNCFTTEDASGSTSQAAGVVESMEAGARLLLVDEDTSATNFMVRDEFMKEVISREKEPITPFIERVREMYEKAGISTIMVAGSSGDFFHVADRVLLMDSYHAVDITERVKELCGQRPALKLQPREFQIPDWKRVLPAYERAEGGQKRRGRGGENSSGHGREDSSGYGRGDGEGQSQRGRGGDMTRGARHEHMKVKSSGLEEFSLDRETINVRYLEQLVDYEQTAGLSYLLRFALEQVMDGRKTVQETVQVIMQTLEQRGWEAFCGAYVPCGLAVPREREVYACLNRFRG